MNKIEKSLARLTKKNGMKTHIAKIRNKVGDIITYLRGIKEIISDSYANTLDNLDKFLGRLNYQNKKKWKSK